MAETHSVAGDQSAPDDLISVLKAIPDGRYRRGVRYLVVPAAGRGARDPEWLPQLPRPGGLCQAAPRGVESGARLGVQALALQCHLPLPVPLRGSLTATTRPTCRSSARCSRPG